jgi:hypothetical protein
MTTPSDLSESVTPWLLPAWKSKLPSVCHVPPFDC